MSKLEESIGFYRKMSDLQEKLRRSEEERLQLEEKFALLMRACRDEEEVRLNNLRERYEAFLEEEKHRKERNDRILQTLDRIESRATILTAKSERLKLLRKHYEVYMLRMYPGWKYVNNRLTETPQTLHSKLDSESERNLPYIGLASTPSSCSVDVPSHHLNYLSSHPVNHVLSSVSHPYPVNQPLTSTHLYASANQPVYSSTQAYPILNQPLPSSQPYASANQPLLSSTQACPSINQPLSHYNHPHVSLNQPLHSSSLANQTSSSSQPYSAANQSLPSVSQPYPSVNYPHTSVQQYPPMSQPHQVPGVTLLERQMNPPVSTEKPPYMAGNQPQLTQGMTSQFAVSGITTQPLSGVRTAPVSASAISSTNIQLVASNIDGRKDGASQELNQLRNIDQIDGYLGRAAEMLKMSGVTANDDKSLFQNSNEIMPPSIKDNKNLGNSVDIELEQNTSGDILNVTLSDDGILQDEPSKTLIIPTQNKPSSEVDLQRDDLHKQEENRKDAKLFGGGDSFVPENNHVKETIPGTDEHGDVLHRNTELEAKNTGEVGKTQEELGLESSYVAENQEQYAKDQQYLEQQQWDENNAQYYQQNGQYYQYGDEMYQQEYGEGEYDQQYAEGEYDQQYAEYTEEEYREYEQQLLQQQQQQQQYEDPNLYSQVAPTEQLLESQTDRQKLHEEFQGIEIKVQESMSQPADGDGMAKLQPIDGEVTTKVHSVDGEGIVGVQPLDKDKMQPEDGGMATVQSFGGEMAAKVQPGDDKMTKIQPEVEGMSKVQPTGGEMVAKVQPDDKMTKIQSEGIEGVAEAQSENGKGMTKAKAGDGEMEAKEEETKREEMTKVQAVESKEESNMQKAESEEMTRIQPHGSEEMATVQQADDGERLAKVQEAEGDDSELSRENVKPSAVPQQLQLSSDVTDPSVTSEKVEQYRQLLGVPATGEPETSDTDELEAQLAALVDTKHDTEKPKEETPHAVVSEQKTSVPSPVKPVTEDSPMSSDSKPVLVQEQKPVVTQKAGRPVSKKLPDLNRVLESDSESLQLDATVSNADSDDFDFSNEK